MLKLEPEFLVSLFSQLACDVGDLECLACFAFQAVENQFYGRKSMLAAKSLLKERVDQMFFNCPSIWSYLCDFEAKGSHQPLA